MKRFRSEDQTGPILVKQSADQTGLLFDKMYLSVNQKIHDAAEDHIIVFII